MASCKAVFENIKLAACAIPAPHMDGCHAGISITFLEIITACCIIWLSTLASNMKHNQYHRGHNTIKDTDEASIACWYRNLKGIRYCLLIMEANHG